jgi:hypothetical protein
MLKREKEGEMLVDGKSVKHLEDCGKYVECDAGSVKLYITKKMVMAKGDTTLDSLGLRKVSWKAKCKPDEPEVFEVDMSLSKARLGGRFPSLLVSKKLKIQGEDVHVLMKEDAGLKPLMERGFVDKNGFLNTSRIKGAVDSVNAGEIQVGADTKDELETLMIFEKAMSHAGAVINDAVKLPTHPDIAEKLAKQEELRRKNLH